MQFSLSIVALAASLLSASAAPHSHLHSKVHARDLSKRLVKLNSLIQVLPSVDCEDVKEGAIAGMPYQNKIYNNASQDATVLFWAKKDFSLPVTVYNTAAPAPLLSLRIPAGQTKTVSFSDNFNGAYAPVFPDTEIGAGGNIKEAWVELTTTLPDNFNPAQDHNPATIDVSYLPGSGTTVVEVTDCRTGPNRCSFRCKNGLATCYKAEDVELINCESHDTTSPFYQKKANSWQNPATGAWEGGCFMAGTKIFTTTFGGAHA